MAHLWIHRQDTWEVLPLTRACITLAEVRRAAHPGAGPDPHGAFCRTGGPREEWHLVAAPGAAVAVNGVRIGTGLRTLTDRDEIRIAGWPRCYFTSERLAATEPLPEGLDMTCPRCRQKIGAGIAAIRCPGCELWHHETSELPCWTYAPTCAMCPQATASGTGFRWTPEGA